MPWTVTLTPEQVARAEAMGEARSLWHKVKNPLGHLNEADPLEQDRQGAAGELAVALCLDVEWNPQIGKGDDAAPDVGGWHVRATEHRNGHLLLYDDGPGWKADPPEDKYVLVVGRRPTLTLVGWCYGHEGKRPEFWRANCRVPCYWIPQSRLRPVRAEVIEERKRRRC